jgi:uncharacterized protein (TIGR02145 family)
MKKIIIFIAAVIFASWGCENDPIIAPVIEARTTPKDTLAIKTSPNSQFDGNTPSPLFNPDLTYGMVTDIDGNVYKTIQIGNQTWMAENLKTTRYNDGTAIYLGTGDMAGETDWFDFRTGAFCWYFNDSNNKSESGIYNWFAVETRKLAPSGWHVPTNEDWELLVSHLGGEILANTKLLSSGTNESGFSAVPSPILCGWGFGPELSFWSSTQGGGRGAFVPYAFYIEIWEENLVPKVSLFSEPQSFGFCVRCVKD